MRFGYWLPGHDGRTRDGERGEGSADWDYIKRIALRGEELGYDLALIAGPGYEGAGAQPSSLDPWSTAAALAAVIRKSELLAPALPALHPPGLLADQSLSVDQISGGRVSLNVISRWNEGGPARNGTRDTRQGGSRAPAAEWVAAVRQHWARVRVSSDGERRRGEGAARGTTAPAVFRPMIYAGGESETARDLIARNCDAYVMDGSAPGGIRDRIADMSRRRERYELPPMKFVVSTYALVRDSEREARDELNRYPYALRSEAAGDGLRRRPDGTAPDRVLRSGLIGTPEYVAERVAEFEAMGVESLLIRCGAQWEEMERFAHTVNYAGRVITTSEGGRFNSAEGLAG